MIAIIPARYESSRFEGKPLAPILGKPMIQWVYERVVKSDLDLADVIVATDDPRIVDAVKRFGGHVMVTAADNRSGTDRVAEAAERAGARGNDIVINVQGDQPLLNSGCIRDLVKPFSTDSQVEMTTLAYRIVDESEIHNPKDVKVTFDMNGYALYFSRSPIPFSRHPALSHDTYKHLGFYAYKKKFLDVFKNLPEGILERIEKLEQLRVLEYGYRINVVVTAFDSPEVDLPEDIKRVENILSSRNIKG